MPIVTKHSHGSFSWAELATSDATAAKKFYGSLFGWTFEDNPAGPDMIYTMNKLGEQFASALYPMGAAMKGIPPHWDAYVTVDDVDAVTKKVVPNGGTVIKEPFDVMDVGRMSVVQDPTGAVLCLWTARKHIGAGVIHDPGAITWNELYTNDVARAAKFYTAVIGWTAEPVDMGPMGTYTLLKPPGSDKNAGGIMPITPQMKNPPPMWLVYFSAKDVDASTKRVEELGGNVLAPPMDIPNVGRFSVVQDPQGAVFALYTNAH